MRRHRRADAPVGLGRASGSVPWGRGSRRRKREPVFPDHSSGVILQPDRLLQACPHPSLSLSLSLSLSPSVLLSIPVFLLLLQSVSPLFLPRCSCCHPSSLYFHHSIPQSSICPAVTITLSLSPPSSKFFYYCLSSSSALSASFFRLHLSHNPTHHLHRLLSVPFRRSLAPSPSLFPSIFPLSAPIHLYPAVTVHLGQSAQQMG